MSVNAFLIVAPMVDFNTKNHSNINNSISQIIITNIILLSISLKSLVVDKMWNNKAHPLVLEGCPGSFRRAPSYSQNNAARLWVIWILEQCLQNEMLDQLKCIAVTSLYWHLVECETYKQASLMNMDIPFMYFYHLITFYVKLIILTRVRY